MQDYTRSIYEGTRLQEESFYLRIDFICQRSKDSISRLPGKQPSPPGFKGGPYCLDDLFFLERREPPAAFRALEQFIDRGDP